MYEKMILQKFSEVYSKHNEQSKILNYRLLLWSWVWDGLSLKRKNAAPLLCPTLSKLIEWLPSVNPNWSGNELKHSSSNRPDSKGNGIDIKAWGWPHLHVQKPRKWVLQYRWVSYNKTISSAGYFFFHRNSCHQNKFILQCFPCCVGDCIFNEIHHLFGVDVLTPRIFDAETFWRRYVPTL